jgi:hypothetical protein
LMGWPGCGKGDDLLLLLITLPLIQNHLSYADQRRVFVIGDEDQMWKFGACGTVFSIRCPRHLADVVAHMPPPLL